MAPSSSRFLQHAQGTGGQASGAPHPQGASGGAGEPPAAGWGSAAAGDLELSAPSRLPAHMVFRLSMSGTIMGTAEARTTAERRALRAGAARCTKALLLLRACILLL